jgi:hypothetical protein
MARKGGAGQRKMHHTGKDAVNDEAQGIIEAGRKSREVR